MAVDCHTYTQRHKYDPCGNILPASYCGTTRNSRMKERSLNLYGTIGTDITAANLAKQLEGAGDYDRLVINLHTAGGKVAEGWAIYNDLEALRLAGKKVVFRIVGMAASMGSFVMLASDEIYMAENSMLMVHAPRGIATGTATSMREGADLLEKIESIMKQGYMKQFRKDEETVQEWLAKDTWFTPQEALVAGLITGIIPPVLRGSATRDFIANISPEVAYAAWIEGPAGEGPTNQPSMETVIAYLDLDGGAKEKDVIKAIQELEATANAAVARAEKAETTLETLRAEMTEQVAASLIDGAVTAGKITAAQKDRYLKLARADYDTTRDLLDSMEAYTPPSVGLKTETDADLVAEWHKRHKDGTLAKLQATDPARYEALAEAFKASKA